MPPGYAGGCDDISYDLYSRRADHIMTDESTQPSSLPNAAVELLWRGDVIAAIKLVCAERNLGLKETKYLVDASVRSSNI